MHLRELHASANGDCWWKAFYPVRSAKKTGIPNVFHGWLIHALTLDRFCNPCIFVDWSKLFKGKNIPLAHGSVTPLLDCSSKPAASSPLCAVGVATWQHVTSGKCACILGQNLITSISINRYYIDKTWYLTIWYLKKKQKNCTEFALLRLCGRADTPFAEQTCHKLRQSIL